MNMLGAVWLNAYVPLLRIHVSVLVYGLINNYWNMYHMPLLLTLSHIVVYYTSVGGVTSGAHGSF